MRESGICDGCGVMGEGRRLACTFLAVYITLVLSREKRSFWSVWASVHIVTVFCVAKRHFRRLACNEERYTSKAMFLKGKQNWST